MKPIMTCLFTMCACLALAVPLYACEGAGTRVGHAVATATGTDAKAATSQRKTVSRQAKPQMTGQAGKQTTAPTKASQTDRVKQQRTRPEHVSSVDFNVLKERLKNTDAIGFFTKLAIRSDIVDLMDKIKTYRKQAVLKAKMKEIRRSFDGLLLKIIALLKDDPQLSRDLYVGRETIWESLLEVNA